MRALPAALALAALLAAAPARSQTSGCAVPSVQCVLVQAFVPIAAPAAVPVTSVSSAYALPVAAPQQTLSIYNLTGTVAWVVLGTGATVAIPGAPATPVPAYGSVWLSVGYNSVLAAVTASGAATLSVTEGIGAPLSISGPVTLAPPLPLAYAAPATVSVGTASTAVAAAGAYSRTLQVCTAPASTTNVWINPAGGAAVVGSGVFVPKAAASCPTFGTIDLPMPTGAITGITDGVSAQNVTLTGG